MKAAHKNKLGVLCFPLHCHDINNYYPIIGVQSMDSEYSESIAMNNRIIFIRPVTLQTTFYRCRAVFTERKLDTVVVIAHLN